MWFGRHDMDRAAPEKEVLATSIQPSAVSYQRADALGSGTTPTTGFYYDI